MEINGEKSRFLNLIEKIGEFSGKHGKRELSQRFALLGLFKKAIKKEMTEVANALLDKKGTENLKEVFYEDGVKVIRQKGAEVYDIDTKEVYGSMDLADFLSIAKITESAFNKKQKEMWGGDHAYDEGFLDKFKYFVSHKSDTVLVKSLTKKELKEYGKDKK